MLLSAEKIEAIVLLEPLLIIAGMVLATYVIYKVLLRDVSQDRHRLMQTGFQNLLAHFIMLCACFALFRVAGTIAEGETAYGNVIETRVLPYIGFITIVWGAIVFVKAARLLLFEYLFFVSRKAGVPALLVNIFSLGLSLAIASWIATTVFGIRLVPVLATSALISVILGLAMQDTLGNIFAGVALQIDKPFNIGDWVEINNAGQKWIGQIREITWRSTVLTGILDEIITVANRTVAQSEIVTWGAGGTYFWRGLSYRIPFGQSIEDVRRTLFDTVSHVPGVRPNPQVCIYLNEIGDSWLNFRVVFALDNYGAQFRTVDRVNTAVMEALLQKKIPVATPAMRIEMLEGK